jgi:hypothetical protein
MISYCKKKQIQISLKTFDLAIKTFLLSELRFFFFLTILVEFRFIDTKMIILILLN